MEVRLENETVWLSLNQIADLFERDKSVISRHLRNIFKTGELQRNRVVAKNATTAADGKTYQVEYYNLDAILSVGYRINSKRGTQFRIWAINVLRDHLIKGYTLNEKQLRRKTEYYQQLKETIGLIGNVIQKQALNSDQTAGLLRVITDFAYALDILDAYDYQRLEITGVSRKKGKAVSYPEAQRIIETLRKQYEAADLFGREKDESLKSSLGTIFQTFDGRPLYPSIEEKAANLLYFWSRTITLRTATSGSQRFYSSGFWRKKCSLSQGRIKTCSGQCIGCNYTDDCGEQSQTQREHRKGAYQSHQ